MSDEDRAPTIDQHMWWLQNYAAEMTADNWRDMKLRIERQLADLLAALAAQQPRGDVEAAVAAERERCAKIADDYILRATVGSQVIDLPGYGNHIAAAIRALPAPPALPPEEG